jgi:hypothetical protein
MVQRSAHHDLAREPAARIVGRRFDTGRSRAVLMNPSAWAVYPARASSLSEAEFDVLVAEAPTLAISLPTAVPGVPVVARKVVPRRPVVAICDRGRMRQAIGILDLPLPETAP